MVIKQVNHLTGGDAVDWIKSGKTLYFPDGFGMDYIYYDDDLTMSFFFVNYEGQHIRTDWNEAHIANRIWEVER